MTSRRTVIKAAALGAVATAFDPGSADASAPQYLVGRGLGDLTGEVAEIGMFGYGSLTQIANGMHFRCRARAFIIVDRRTRKRIAFVVTDLGAITDPVRKAVLVRLGQKFGSTYVEANVVLTATHTHCSPGGISWSNLYNLTAVGFKARQFEAVVAGIVDAVRRAHEDLSPGRMALGHAELHNAGAQRSRVAFDKNPKHDKAFFPAAAIDPQSTTLRFDRRGKTVGAINWFGTHGTSMPDTNLLVSPDNKGYAALHWEREVSGIDYLNPDSVSFVAAFAQSNAGDITPNLNLRPGSGPTNDPFKNVKAIGLRTFDAAVRGIDHAENVHGGIDYRFSYLNLGGGVKVGPEFTGDGQSHVTCSGAYGASFAAGSVEDGGGGLPIFVEGSNPLEAIVSQLLYTASPELRDCQAPKDILLPTGALNMTQQICPIHLLRIGQLYLLAAPQEFTITAGLRIRRTVAQIVGARLEDVIISGYANAYAAYVTTPEEYTAQQFEGGATLFGKWTSPAYQQEFARLAHDMVAARPAALGVGSPNLAAVTLALPDASTVDVPGANQAFGQVLVGPAPKYGRGQTVAIKFTGAHPNNNPRRDGTYLEVQSLRRERWVRVYDDGDWSTKFTWTRVGLLSSEIDIAWEIPSNARIGSYRIVYHGDAAGTDGSLTPFTGSTAAFSVT